jgi:hypothetical protein
MRILLLATAIALLPFTSMRSELAAQPLETSVFESELIVLAKVTAMSAKDDDKMYATAQVLETWKGTPTKYVEFLAEGTWACDMTEAHVGETVVLFLVRGEPSRSYLIDGSGGGRLPVQVVDDIAYATSLGYLVLPDWVHTTAATEDHEYPRLVRLDTLRELVAVTLRALPAQKPD